MAELLKEHSSEPQLKEPDISPDGATPARQPAPRGRGEHGGIYAHFRNMVASAGGQEPPPEQFAGLLQRSEYPHWVNDAQKARVVGALQQQFGNRYVQRVMESNTRASTDSWPNMAIQRKEANAVSDGSMAGVANLQVQLERNGGQPLDDRTRAFMESRFDYDFSNVRIHNDSGAASAASAINAQAFTSGRDIYFGASNYQPGTNEGQRLLAHELVHTIQQNPGRTSKSQNIVQARNAISEPSDRLEQEAENIADYVINGNTVDNSQIASISSGVRETIVRQSTEKSSASKSESGEETKSPIHIKLQKNEYSTTREISESFDYGSIEVKTRIETNYSDVEGGGLGPYRDKPAVNYYRDVTIRTKSGAIVNLHIHVRGFFSAKYEHSGTDSEFYMAGNKEVMYDINSGKETEYESPVQVIGMYYLDGYLASDRTPVRFNVRNGGYFGSNGHSVFDNLNGWPQLKFLRTDLTPEQQFQAIIDVLEMPQPKKKKERRGRQVEYPTQEEFEQMTQEEKKDLAWEKAWEEFSVGNVVKGVLIGLAVIGVAVLAVLAAKAGAVLAAIILAGAFFAAIGYGLYKLLGELFGGLDTVPEILKNIALTVGIILGAIVFVFALLGTTLTGLGLLALGLFAAAVVIGFVLVFLNIDKASKAESVEDFQRHVTRSAREAEGAFELAIILVFLGLWGKFARGGESKLPGEQEIGIEPSRAEPIDIDPIEGGFAEFIGENQIRFNTTRTSEIGEIISTRPGIEGEVLHVRLRNGQEEWVAVDPEPIQGYHRYRLTSPPLSIQVPESARSEEPISIDEPIRTEEPVRIEEPKIRVEEPAPVAREIPKPTPEEYAVIDRYVETLRDLGDAYEAGETARIRAKQQMLDYIETHALEEQGKGSPYNYLWEHIRNLIETRLKMEKAYAEGNWVFPIEIETASGKKAYIEGMGRKFDAQSTRFDPFRGKTYTQVEETIGRPPDVIEGKPPGRVRLTWRFSDNSFIHVDVPGTENTSPYLINRQPHLSRTAPVPNQQLHLSDQGISVPAESTPAHIEIQPDARLQQRITGGNR